MLDNRQHGRPLTVVKTQMLQADSSPHYSVIALEEGDSEREAGVGVSEESLQERILEWVIGVSELTLGGDLRRTPNTIAIDKPAGKAGTAGRDTAIIEENKGVGGSVSDDLTREKVADSTKDLLAHLTISQDQTSNSQFSRENLAALSKPLDEAGIVLDHRESVRLDPIMSRSTRSHSAGLRDSSEDWGYYLRLPPAPLESSLAPRRLRRKSPRKVYVETRDHSSDSSSTEKKSIGSAMSKSNDSVEEQSHHERWVPESTLELSHRIGRGILRESNVVNNLDASAHTSSPEQYNSMEDLLSRVKSLERENYELRNVTTEETSNPAPPPVPHYTWRTFHCIDPDIFLESPQWKEGERGPVLHASSPLQNVRFYLEQHPEIAFIFYKDYDQFPPADNSKLMSKDGVFRIPEPSKQTLMLTSEHMISAVERLGDAIPDFANFFPDFDPYREIPAPYMFIYHSLPLFDHIVPHLTPLEHELLEKLNESVLASHGKEYVAAKRCEAKGMVSRRLVKYLVRPGDVLIRTQDSVPRAYVATSWAKEKDPDSRDFPTPDEGRHRKLKAEKNQVPRKRTYSFEFNAWSWAFDGSFEKRRITEKIQLQVGDEDDEVRIADLNYFPLRFDGSGLHELLEERGKMFWKCRTKHFVSYSDEDNGVLSSVGERYMIDIDTYKTLHPNSQLSIYRLHPDIDAKTMTRDKPPEKESLLVFPPMITGYNLQTKKWRDLLVDRISDVTWNKQAFESLVAKEKTKELVQALITNQLANEKSTDLILGKGNGLTILLHGGPGTGKTFTAEGVAEIAEKPLFRVTCGDIGTKPDEVEKYLESVFNLGKIWDCVVLLDEADVFLEERGLADLQRNALVSVFLRVLEYNVGILILTSNRVGTFDEAFKSRIQLSLHYENLTVAQQKKIWRNFLARLRSLDASSIEFDDIMDNVDELVKEDMNGRQIRNAITTARQLALYKEKTFCYEHLKHVIEVSGEFEKYLKTLRQGLSDDQLKREVGFR